MVEINYESNVFCDHFEAEQSQGSQCQKQRQTFTPNHLVQTPAQSRVNKPWLGGISSLQLLKIVSRSQSSSILKNTMSKEKVYKENMKRPTDKENFKNL